jgi:hypothetical protein
MLTNTIDYNLAKKIFLQFWSLEIQDQGVSMFVFFWALIQFADDCFFPVTLYDQCPNLFL